MASSDYISREALLSATNGYDWQAGLKTVLKRIPAADVVTVVRCKDCMYQKDELGRWCLNDYENELRDDDFCSHGKRKESKT